jgi:hypothetical protein
MLLVLVCEGFADWRWLLWNIGVLVFFLFLLISVHLRKDARRSLLLGWYLTSCLNRRALFFLLYLLGLRIIELFSDLCLYFLILKLGFSFNSLFLYTLFFFYL